MAARRKFNPTLHPRDRHGRFTRSATKAMDKATKARARDVGKAFKPRRGVTGARAPEYLRGIGGTRPAGRDSPVGRFFGDRDTFTSVQAALRAGHTDDPQVRALDDAEVELPDDLLVSRRVPADAFGDVSPEDLVGMQVRDAAYSPVSLTTVRGNASDVRMRIAVPAGTRALANPDTGELALDRDLDMAVTSVERNSAGGYDMYLVVLPKQGTGTPARGNEDGREPETPTAPAGPGQPSAGGGTAPDQPGDADAFRAQLMRRRVPELRQQAKDRGLKPGKARKSQLVDMLVGDEFGQEGPAPAQPAVVRRAEPRPHADLVAATTEEAQSRLDEFRNRFARIFEGEHAGLTTRITSMEADANVTVANGDIFDADGKRVGGFIRALKVDDDRKLYADHLALELDPHMQGQGFAKAFNDAAVKRYRDLGVDRVELVANIDVGGYAWSRDGYDWANEYQPAAVLVRLQDALWNNSRIPADRLDQQLTAARGMLDRASSAEFGAPDFPTAYEISQLGRWEGAGKDDMWIGKLAMLGASWRGRKPLATPQRSEKLDELGQWHSEWVGQELPAASRSFDPAQRPDNSDYGQHHVDLDASGEAQDRFHERADDIMQIPASGPGSEPQPVPDLAALLRAATNLEDGRALLATVRGADLDELAAALGIVVRRSDSARRKRATILQFAVGRRLDSAAVSGIGGRTTSN